MKRIFTLCMGLLLAAAGLWAQDKPKGIDLSESELQLVQQNNDFAFRLFREAQTGDNQMLSPLSITYALGMLNNGAAGQTQEEINKVLGALPVASKGEDLGVDAINKFCRKMLSEAPLLDKETTVGIANTIYVNEAIGCKLQPAFVETAKLYYDATPEARNFFDGQTLDVINQWGNDHTNGLIPRILTEETFNPNFLSYLLNALYFKGKWTNTFKEGNTKEEPFNGKDNVPMMHIPFNAEIMFEYADNDLYQVVRLPYGNEAYRMTVFLPREGKSINDVLDVLDGKSWNFQGKPVALDLKLPRFDTDTDIDLVPVMQALGIDKAFTSAAEFPYFCNTACHIGMMRQSSKITVNEEGTEAAAVTIIGMDKAMPMSPVDFHANRPFLYIISEQSTDVIFFIGQYTGLGGEARETHGIPSIEDSSNSQSNAIYNLNGQRLSAPPAHGVYIEGGRKMRK